MANESRGGPQINDPIPIVNGQHANAIADGVRVKMADFWKEHSQNANEEEMMLDTNADILGKEEIPEILSMLPDFKGKDVLELGAGIGRFTGHMASKAGHVVAIDFMENFVRRNSEINGHFKNIEFLQADVTNLEYPSECFDLVFSNWLLMYLEENEVARLFSRVFDWLRPGGFFYFRESCFHQSGNKSRDSNPSQYRKPSMYNDVLKRVGLHGNEFSLRLVMSKSIQSYIKMKNNRNQICWLVQKVPSNDHEVKRGCRVFGEHFENSFVTLKTVDAVEKYFGDGHISSGDNSIFERIVDYLKPREASSLLNIGCGLGCMAYRLARKYNIKVCGIDPSANMVALCLERANAFKLNNVQFWMEDFCRLSLPSDEFDSVLYYTSADVEDHLELFKKIETSMKQDGRLVVVDYCIKDESFDSLEESLSQHIKKLDYHILNEAGYKQVLSDAGFELEQVENLSGVKMEALQSDVHKLQDNDRLTQTLKESILRKREWMEGGQLRLVCFVCRSSSTEGRNELLDE